MRTGFRFPSGGDVVFTVAPARNRPRDTRTAVPLGSYSDVFLNCRKSFHVAGAILCDVARTFLHFSWQAKKTIWKGCVK